MSWFAVILAGFVTYFTRFSMITFVSSNMLSKGTKKVLSYVPSSVFPAIIFPAIFLDNAGSLQIEDNPKILAAIIATIVGIFTRNIIATIFSGLASYWFLIFVV